MSIHNQSQGQKLVLKDFGKPEKLATNISCGWNDGLIVKLRYFSHKESFVGGPTKATAYVDFQKAGEKGEITLSVYGTEGKAEQEYEKLHWKNYNIELLGFEYDHNIEIKISKEDGIDEVGYFINDKSVTRDAFEELKNSLTEMKGTWYCKEFKDGGETGYKGVSKDGKIYHYKSISKTSGSVEVLEQE